MEPAKQPSNLKQKALVGVFWSAIESWGRQLLSLAVFFILARLLGPETFGLVALASVFLAFLQVFLDQGFTQAIVQRQNLEPEHLDTAFWTNLGISFILTILCFSSADLVGHFFKEPQIIPILKCLSINFIITAFNSVQNALFERKLAFKTLAKRSLLAVTTGGIVGVTMAFMGFGVWSLVGQQLFNSLAGVLVIWWASDWRPKFRFSPKHFKELFAFGVNVVGMNIAYFISRRSDDFLIGYFLGSSALGYYSVGYRVFSILTELLTSVLSKVTLPTFARLQQDPERLRNALYQAIQLSSLITFPGFLITSVLAPELIQVVFGEKWLPSVPIMQILNLSGIAYAYFYFNGSVLMAIGRPSAKLAIDLIQAMSNIIGFAIAVKWGIVAVAAAFVIRLYLMAPVIIWIVWKYIRINLLTYLRQGATSLAATLAMVVAILSIKYFLSSSLSTIGILSISLIVGISVYVLSIVLIAPKLLRQIVSIVRPIQQT
ncbi:lipopolysaccharide biosynthesis protein [Nostoc sp. FACHB-110]|uniref:lipopolysaccharide biosynthesis protein n=1 Tax=Nostoc sp. FACHB-110 TaxID=2692834 RepID=UPI00168653BA|nr:lipopolysaccharide biosynthesis protein [Nostoc sp. FACHB-110]MBD2436525.1 lipopolysaccharide biosynthesis protein [Nostoc sp. FACHB-110]